MGGRDRSASSAIAGTWTNPGAPWKQSGSGTPCTCRWFWRPNSMRQRRESRTKLKAGRSGRGTREEPKLEMKKHRRVSRKRSKQGQLKDYEAGGGRAWEEL